MTTTGPHAHRNARAAELHGLLLMVTIVVVLAVLVVLVT